MLLHTKKIIGHKLAATDGEIGHVHDFYFDDQTWAIRYLVAGTGTWFKERRLLLSPRDFVRSDESGQVLPVNLTRDQIEHSPSSNQHRPVSGQCVAKFYHDSGWPARWQGQRLWGTTDPPFAISAPPMGTGASDQNDDAHLHGTQTVTGYHIEATDGVLGAVSGFVLDDQTWTVRHVVVETGHWYAGREIFISPDKIERVSYPESKVFVSLTKDDLRHTLAHQVAGSAP